MASATNHDPARMHLNSILGKLGANDRTHALRIAATLALLSLWEAM
jgi:DNA-binding CsgD family transcriptional regulator